MRSNSLGRALDYSITWGGNVRLRHAIGSSVAQGQMSPANGDKLTCEGSGVWGSAVENQVLPAAPIISANQYPGLQSQILASILKFQFFVPAGGRAEVSAVEPIGGWLE